MTHIILEASKSKICMVGWQPGPWESQHYSSDLKMIFYRTRMSWCCKWGWKVICWKILSWSEEAGVLVLFWSSTDGMRPTHIIEGNLLYSKSTDLNINLTQKYPHRHIQNNAWPSIWASHGSAKLTHKRNIHIIQGEDFELLPSGQTLSLKSHILISIWISPFGCLLGAQIMLKSDFSVSFLLPSQSPLKTWTFSHIFILR